MAAPSYTTDLATIDLCDASSTYEEFTGYALGDNAAVETDWYLQGSQCASDEANNKTGVGHSIGVDYGSDLASNFTTGVCFFAWMQCQAGNAMNNYANGGYRVLIGSTTTNFSGWAVGGSDVGRNPYGGWVNVVVDPTHTADYTGGTGLGSTIQHFAVAFNMSSGISKGRPLNADAMRYGRGEVIIEHGDLSNGYGAFSGIATQNDNNTNMWGLFSDQFGSYLWKGLLSFGNATNSCDFRDSNANIIVDETPKTYAAFNKIEINNASSRVDWTGVNITALQDAGLGADSGLSPGNFEMVDNATVNFTNCVFTDMNTFVFQSNATLDTVTWRRCALVTQGGADLDDCVFDEPTGTVGLLVSNLNNIDNCDFTSDGTGHAMELTSAHAGNSYTLVGCTYTGYAGTDGSTGNEVIYNNSGGAVTINISGGDTPTIRNGTDASTTVVAGAVTVKVTVTDAAGTLIDNARVILKAANGTGPFPYQDTVTIVNSGTTATVTHTAHGMATNDKVEIRGASLAANNGVFSITYISANSYSYTMGSTPGSSPTGTITSTFVALSGLTSSGVISTSRVYSSNQPVIGWARKSSASPYYKTGPLSGTVDSNDGYNNTAVLTADE